MRVLQAIDQPLEAGAFFDIRRNARLRLAKEGMFFAEGEGVVYRLLQSGLEVRSLLMTPEYWERWQTLVAANCGIDTVVLLAGKNRMEEITGQKLNQGCVAICMVPRPPSMRSLLEQGPCCFVALDGIDHAVNVGAIVRNCAAFDATALLVDEKSAHPYSLRAIRSSLGGIFQMPVFSEIPLLKRLQELRDDHGIQLIAADVQGPTTLMEIVFHENCCLIFGSEHNGISDEILRLASLRVRIQHSSKVDSLNVAAASAVFLHRARESKFFSRPR